MHTVKFSIQTEPARLLPVNTVYAVFEGHQKPLPHRKLQVFWLCDDQHVWAGQRRAEVVQVDLAVVRHQTNADVRHVITILPARGRGCSHSAGKRYNLMNDIC